MSDVIRQPTAPRIYFDEPVTIIVENQEEPLVGRALNISSGGIFICAPQLLTPGQIVELHFCLPDGDPVTIQSEVLRTIKLEDAQEPTGMALRFIFMEPDFAERMERFISSRLQPAQGEVVRLKLGELGFPIVAKTQSYWDDFLCVDAELPFLRLGSSVTMQFPDHAEPGGGQGVIRWVSVHVPPETAVPRLNIGIELKKPSDCSDIEEDTDPVCNQEFAEHSRHHDAKERAEKKSATGSSR